MNRPTRITLIGMALCLALAAVISVAQAQNSQVAQLRRQYDACVVEAVLSQRQANPRILVSLAVEMAFQACATEERAMVAPLYSLGGSAVEINQVVSDIKANLKRIIRDAAAGVTSVPSKYIGCESYKRYDGETVYINCPNR